MNQNSSISNRTVIMIVIAVSLFNFALIGFVYVTLSNQVNNISGNQVEEVVCQRIVIADGQGTKRMILGVDQNQYTYLRMLGPKGYHSISLGVDASGGTIFAMSKEDNAELRVDLGLQDILEIAMQSQSRGNSTRFTVMLHPEHAFVFQGYDPKSNKRIEFQIPFNSSAKGKLFDKDGKQVWKLQNVED